MDWVITVPQTIIWSDYEKELEAAANGAILNYRVSRCPKLLSKGDRCFILHKGKVRGWMQVIGLWKSPESWVCSTTGNAWPAGTYIQRSGVFHEVDGPLKRGFQGIRKFPEGTNYSEG